MKQSSVAQAIRTEWTSDHHSLCRFVVITSDVSITERDTDNNWALYSNS